MNFQIQSGTVARFTASIKSGWHNVKFKHSFPKGAVPLVFVQIQSQIGGDTPGLRIRNVNSKGFQVRMDEVVLSQAKSSTLGDLGKLTGIGKHPSPETLAWMAINQEE